MIRPLTWLIPCLAVASGGIATLAVVSAQENRSQREASLETGVRGHGKLVFVLTTGLEDLQSVNMAVRHAGMAKKSGFLDDSVLLVYGRAVQALSKNITAKPPQLAAALKEAKDAGARILVCGEAIKRFNIPKEDLDPAVDDVVPNAIVTLAELVSKGYQVIKY